MKRYLLLACLGGWLTVSGVQAQEPVAGPSVDLGPNIAASEIPGPVPTPGVVVAEEHGAKPNFVTRVSGFFGARTAPAECCAPEGTCVGSVGCEGAKCGTREKLAKFGYWLTYHNSCNKTIPCFRPTPWQPPLYNWFPCAEGCAPGCGAGGCGGPPITYYYPTKAPEPKIELRGLPPRQPGAATGTAQAPAKKPASLLPGMRFASAEMPSVQEKKRTPGITPASAVAENKPEPPATAAARPGESPFGFHPTSFKKYEFQPTEGVGASR